MRRQGDAVLLKAVDERVAGDFQKTGCSGLVPGVSFQRLDNDFPLQLLQGVAFIGQLYHCMTGSCFSAEFFREVVTGDSVAVPHDEQPFHTVFQLPHIARPGIAGHGLKDISCCVEKTDMSNGQPLHAV